MGFDEHYYTFIEHMNEQQKEAMNDITTQFYDHDDETSSSELKKSQPQYELPAEIKNISEEDLDILKATDIPVSGPDFLSPQLEHDPTGVITWKDPQSTDEYGKKIKFRCPAIIATGKFAGKRCFNYAGYKTDHYGIGKCIAHGGAKRKGRAEAGWIFMHAMARALNVSPWDALLGQIRLLAGQVAFLTEKVGTAAECDDDLLPDGNAFYWMELLEQRGERLAKVSKMAIDAGIAERLIAVIEEQASMLNAAVKKTAIEMQLTEDEQYEMITSIARNYQELEEKSQNT